MMLEPVASSLLSQARPKGSNWKLQQHLEREHTGVLALDPTQYKKLLREIQVICPLRVSTYGAASSLSCTIRWQQVQVSCHRGLADAGDMEASLRFDQWAAVFAITEEAVATPGIYIYDHNGAIVASICLDNRNQMWSFLAKLPTQAKRGGLGQALSHIAGPEVVHRRRASIRRGFGPQTHQDARAAQIVKAYALARCEALDCCAPTRCIRVSPLELPALFQALHEGELPVSIVSGPSGFWQFHQTLLELSSSDAHLELQGRRCKLRVATENLSEVWLTRTHHQGNFSYSLLFYDNRLALDLVVLFPECHIAASVSDWRALIHQVGSTLRRESGEYC